MNQWASHYGPSDYVEPWSRAAEQQRGCFRRYLTQGLEQFRSNLSLRALTYSLLSWVGFLLETTTTSWSLVSWNSMMYKKGEIIECLSDVCSHLFLFYMIYIQSQFCSHRPEAYSFPFSLTVAQWYSSPAAVISITHRDFTVYYFPQSFTLFSQK